jgi:hypothetical protein
LQYARALTARGSGKMGCTRGETRVNEEGKFERCIGGIWVRMPGPPAYESTGASAQLVVDPEQLITAEIRSAVNSEKKVVYVVIRDVRESND